MTGREAKLLAAINEALPRLADVAIGLDQDIDRGELREQVVAASTILLRARNDSDDPTTERTK